MWPRKITPDIAGKWVAWSRDRRMIAACDTLAEAIEHGRKSGDPRVSYEKLPTCRYLTRKDGETVSLPPESEMPSTQEIARVLREHGEAIARLERAAVSDETKPDDHDPFQDALNRDEAHREFCERIRKVYVSTVDMARDTSGDEFADELDEFIDRHHIVSGLMGRRAALGLTVDRFASLSGLTLDEIEAFESSEDRTADIDLLIRYSAALVK